MDDYRVAMSVKPEVQTSRNLVRTGMSFGCALAMVISWSANKSILWACGHGLLSWGYVVYYAVVS